MPLRSLLAAAVLLVAIATVRADDWTPAEWKDQETIDILTIGAEEGPYEFKVWPVVIDDQVYLRLGSRAAERFEKNTTKPYVGIKIAGKDFAKVRAQPAPEMEQRVGKAMADKYTSDIFIRYLPHPLIIRLVAE